MICLDANVLIEIILKRTHVKSCENYLAKARQDLAITTITVDLVMYYAEGKYLNLPEVELLLRQIIWLAATEADTHCAFAHYKGNDFEDALQIAIVLREGCARFATLDKQLARKYKELLPIDLLS